MIRKIVKALIASAGLVSGAFAGTHVQQGDPITVSSVTITGTGIRFQDGTVQTTAGGGGGGSASLETMANSVRITSPTATQNFVGTANGIRVQGAATGSTATITFSMLPGNTNYVNSPATGTWVNDFGMKVSTLTATDSIRIEHSNSPILTIERNSPGADSGSIEYTTLGTQKAALQMGAGGYDIRVTTGSGTTPVTRIGISNQSSNNAQIQFNPSNAGFTLKESSITFESGSRDPVMEWSTDGRIKFFAPAGLANQYGLSTATMTFVSASLQSQSCLGTDSSGNVQPGTCSGGGGGGTPLETLFGTSRSSPTLTLRGDNTMTGSVTSSTMTIGVSQNLSISTITVSSATVGSLSVNGSGPSFLRFTESTSTSAIAGQSVIQSNSSTHFLELSNNGGNFGKVVISTVTTTANKCAQWSADGQLGMADASCGTGSGGGYATIQDEGSAVTQRTTVNFIGSGVSCVDNSGSSRTDCTVSGGSGSPSGGNYKVQVSSNGSFGYFDGLDLNGSTATFSSVKRVEYTNLSTVTASGVYWNLIGSSMTISSATVVNDLSVQGNVLIKGAQYLQLNSFDNSAAALMQNPSIGSSQLAITAGAGAALNGSVISNVDFAVYKGFFGDYGRFAVVGSSANATSTYSGWTSTSSVHQSTLWSMPRRDGPAGSVLSTDGLTHTYYADNTRGIGSLMTDLAVGTTIALRIRVSGTLVGAVLDADTTGSVTVNVSSSSVRDVAPVSICGSNCPSLSSSNAGSDRTLTGWSKTLIKDGYIYFYIKALSTITDLTLVLEYLPQ